MHLSNYCRRYVPATCIAISMTATCSLITLPAALAEDAGVPSETDFWEHKIRPLLVERCQKCHGEKNQRAGLRLDSLRTVLAGGDSGPSMIPGDPDNSELFKRVASTDDDLRMPPSTDGPPLDAEQIDLIRRWIDIGAPWPETSAPEPDVRGSLHRDHWAFQPIRRVNPPTVSSREAVHSPIDKFVIAKLQSAGMNLNAVADRRTLVRRATYDLHGLPPSEAEVAAFVYDRAPNAYEQLIERLLASPRYGEHLGRHWLDVARYSDTKGYVFPREERHFVHSSLYRDWVISAFNDDLPYDRFLSLQMAADLVAPDDHSSLAAMGFLTLGRRFRGVTPDIIDDRIDVVSRGILGLTVTCARCHNHKYDPIPTADYYSLYGVFQNCTERQLAIPRQLGAPPPTAEFEQGLRERLQKIQEVTAKARGEANDRIRDRLVDYLLAQRELDKYPQQDFNQVVPKEDLIPGIVHYWQSYLANAEKHADPIFAAWIAYNRLNDDDFSDRAAAITQQLQDNSASINPRVAKAFEQPPKSITEVAKRYAELLADVDKQWIELCDTAENENRPLPAALPDNAAEQLRQAFFGVGSPCVIPDEPIVNTEAFWDNETLSELWKAQFEFDQLLLQSPTAVPHAAVLVDRPTVVDPQIFRRGNPANRGEIVPRQFLQAIAGSERRPFVSGSGRLELAHAIIDPTNPLTARVWTNRMWLHLFGAGLVTTPSDFGVRSAPPSHPELLDWLATEFIEHGWSTKSLHRQIMLSSTYRQSSVVNDLAFKTAQELDPENRLLWRMNPRRLSFEQYRDSLLSLSGTMDVTMGGKGTDLFGHRRSVYVTIDRQFLPNVMGVFDFANPDLHSGSRTETTIPQQSLFSLNHPFVAQCAKELVARLATDEYQSSAHIVNRLFGSVLLRNPSSDELKMAQQFLLDAKQDSISSSTLANVNAWSYGFGDLDQLSGRLRTFQSLPYFATSAWQGGPQWPDPSLGWVQLTAHGGHPGNDHRHAAVRRWTATLCGTVSITSEVVHSFAVGDGVKSWIVSNRHGILQSAAVHNGRKPLNVDGVKVEPGDTIDFVVDLADDLNNDQFIWIPSIALRPSSPTAIAGVYAAWKSDHDFAAAHRELLSPLEQLTQLLLISNEVMFVD